MSNEEFDRNVENATFEQLQEYLKIITFISIGLHMVGISLIFSVLVFPSMIYGLFAGFLTYYFAGMSCNSTSFRKKILTLMSKF